MGYVAVYASYDDGAFEDVTAEASFKSQYRYIHVNSSTGEVEVAFGASSFCGHGVEVHWNVCNESLGTGKGLVIVDLPSPVGCTLTLSSARIARVGDGATLAPFSVPSAVTLSVVVLFDDGSTKDLSEDPRTLYSVVGSGGDVITLSGRTVTVAASANLSTAVTSTLAVSFSGAFEVNNIS